MRPLENGQSQYENLKEYLAYKFNASTDDVAIFSIMPENRSPEILQIYYTLLNHRKSPTFLNGLISVHRHELEAELGLGTEVVQVGVNDCVFENCGPGCKTMLTVGGVMENITSEYWSSCTSFALHST